MFSQKKSFFKGKIFYILIAGLLAFGYWINQVPDVSEEGKGISAGSGHSTTISDEENEAKGDDIENNIIRGTADNTGDAGVLDGEKATNSDENSTKGYYLVKEAGGVIKVFYYDEEGNEKLLRTTDIAFSLLSIVDQDLFQKGVIKYSIDELDELLQDFES